MKQTVPVALLCSCHFIIKVNKVGPVYIAKAYKAVEVQPLSFLTMVLDGV